MKKLTLDETWKKCLSMWWWIAKQKPDEDGDEICGLKDQWLKKHRYKEFSVMCDCFFCEYDDQHRGIHCEECPGVKVDKTNKRLWCQNEGTDWRCEPIAFYNKLVSLNRKRLARKKK